MAKEIGQGNEIILSKMSQGNELRNLQLSQNKLKFCEKAWSWMGGWMDGCKNCFKDCLL